MPVTPMDLNGVVFSPPFGSEDFLELFSQASVGRNPMALSRQARAPVVSQVTLQDGL